MKVVEFVGICVTQCDCGKKFVINSEVVHHGFQWTCECGRQGWSGVGQKLQLNLPIYKEHPCYGSKEFDRHLASAALMPLEEYKRMLASIIIEGKKPRVPAKHKNTIEINVNKADYLNLYESLRQLGFQKEEAISKVDIALQEGFIRETDIIKYILSLN